MKQYKIDNGEIGGLIHVFGSSLIVLQPFSFIGILALNYDRFIKNWIDLNTFIVISTICFIVYEWIFFAFVFPSMIRFSNRQGCMHENPIYIESQKIKSIVEKIDIKLNREKDNL